MSLLKKENWWIWILLWIFTNGYSNIILGVLLGVLDKKAWYAKWYLWIIGLILIFPIIIMFIIFNIEVSCKTADKLDVKGKKIYLSPYIWELLLAPLFIWIVCLILHLETFLALISVITLITLLIYAILLLYLSIAIFIKLHNGNGEKYIR